MSTYTLSRACHRRWDTDTDANRVCFSIKDSDGTEVFEVRITRKVFDMLTDQQVTDYITWCCEWHKRRKVDGDVSSPTVDATLNTRIGGFIGDEITVS